LTGVLSRKREKKKRPVKGFQGGRKKENCVKKGDWGGGGRKKKKGNSYDKKGITRVKKKNSLKNTRRGKRGKERRGDLREKCKKGFGSFT